MGLCAVRKVGVKAIGQFAYGGVGVREFSKHFNDMIFAWTTVLVGFLMGAKVICGHEKQK